MKHLKHSLTRPLSNPHTGAVVFLLVVAVIGFIDASYLTIEHYRNVIPPCTTSGCETVLTSPYSIVMGMPVSLLGVLNYLAIAIGALIYLESKFVSGNTKDHHRAILKWTLLATTLGLLASLWFLYLQAFVIHAYCLYCLGSATTSTILFLTSVAILGKSTMIDLKGMNAIEVPKS